jgi:hypothetical protein
MKLRLGLRPLLAVLVLGAFLPVATTACFGKFQLTRKVYQFNRDISHDKWVEWLAFLVLVIVPIYGIAVLVDAVVANSLEFWTGDNPISAQLGTRHTAQGPNGELIVTHVREPGLMDLEITDAQGNLHAFTLVREKGSVAAYDGAGRLVSRVGDVGGEPGLLAAAP